MTRRRRKATERAIALGEDSPDDYAVALELGIPDLDVFDTMPHEQYVRWRSFLRWRAAHRQHQRDVAEMRANQ